MTEKRPTSALRRLQELDAQRARGETPGGPGAPGGTDAPAHRTQQRRGRGGLVAVGLLLLWKFKFVALFMLGKFKLLFVGLKLLKFGKLYTTGWTMLLSMWVYSMYFGAPFAIGFVLLVLIHELGHGLAARLIGLPVGAPVFIPFFGAMIALKQAPRNTFQDFIIGLGGPLAGTLGGLACLGVSLSMGSAGSEGGTGGQAAQLLYVLGYFTFVINLFNLTPVWQLDGARIAAPFRVSMWAAAVVLLAAVVFISSGAVGHLNPVTLIVVLAGAYRLFEAWRTGRRYDKTHPLDHDSALQRLSALQHRALETRDIEVSERGRWISWGAYVGLSSLLIVLVHELHSGLPVV